MDRIRSLIDKINEQYTQQVPLVQLLSTVHLLQNEISGTMREVNILGTSGISVIAANTKPLPELPGDNSHKNESTEKEYYELKMDDHSPDEKVVEPVKGIPSYEELMKWQEQLNHSEPRVILSFSEDTETAADMPTLSRQPRSGNSKAAKQASAPRAGKAAVKDLYKAISAQDRIAFVRELFRGDEIMFERSIKTINNFSSLTEAEYWIERELKTKNGWMPGHPVAGQFEQLVKRRFA